MKYWLIGPVAGLFLVTAAVAQSPNAFSKIPAQPVSVTRSAPTPALPPTQVISPPATMSCDCDSSTHVPRRQWRRLLLEEQCASARDMIPHYAYKAPYEGSYYFRPYVAQQIGKQADIVGGWGLDRANPYDNRFLQAIYDQPRQ